MEIFNIVFYAIYVWSSDDRLAVTILIGRSEVVGFCCWSFSILANARKAAYSCVASFYVVLFFNYLYLYICRIY